MTLSWATKRWTPTTEGSVCGTGDADEGRAIRSADRTPLVVSLTHLRYYFWFLMSPTRSILPFFWIYRLTVAWATSPFGRNFTVVVMPL